MGCFKLKVTHGVQQVWGDSPASLHTPSWPPHLVILLGQKNGRLAGITLSTSFSPKSMSYSEGERLLVALCLSWLLLDEPWEADLVPPLAEVGCSGCFTQNQHLKM